MSAHLRDDPTRVLADALALRDRWQLMCRTWGRVPGDDDADEASVLLAEACSTMSAAILRRDDYTEADRAADRLHARQDERRGIVS